MPVLQPPPTPPQAPTEAPVPSPTPLVESPSPTPAVTDSPSPVPAQAPLDSEPLLSTLVQSGAALVAIIAGLLIARLVALAGERSSLERRVRELSEMRDARRAEYALAHRERLAEDAGGFVNHVLDRYFSEDTPTFEKMYDSYDDEAGDGEELRAYYDRFVEQAGNVINRIRSGWDLFADGRTNWSDDGERDAILHQFPGEWDRATDSREDS